MNRLKTLWRGFRVDYIDQIEVGKLIREVDYYKEYEIDLGVSAPIIIDVGAHIGTSVLYFKSIYPQAKIVALEPDPVSFKLLERNIKQNRLNDIKCLNVAAWVKPGSAKLVKMEKLRWANSLSETIWSRESQSKSISVKAVQLSSLIKSKVDLLKLDIEGAEFEVVKEIADKIFLIRNMIVECHFLTSDIVGLVSMFNDLSIKGFRVCFRFKQWPIKLGWRPVLVAIILNRLAGKKKMLVNLYASKMTYQEKV